MNDNELFSFKRDFESYFGLKRVEFVTNPDKYNYEAIPNKNSRLINGSRYQPFTYTVDFETMLDPIERRIKTKVVNVYGEFVTEFKLSELGFMLLYSDRVFPEQQIDYNPNILILDFPLEELDHAYWVKDFDGLLKETIDSLSLPIEIEDEKGKWVEHKFDILEVNY